MEETKKEVKNKINWAVGLSVVAVILSIFSFFISEGTLKFDSINFIIGVLAILVTFLLGWQIYNIIGVNERLSQFSINIENRLSQAENALQQQYIINNFNSYKELSVVHTFTEDTYFYLRSMLLTLIFGHNITNPDETTIRDLNEFSNAVIAHCKDINDVGEIGNLSIRLKMMLLQIIDQNPNIRGFSELRELLL